MGPQVSAIVLCPMDDTVAELGGTDLFSDMNHWRPPLFFPELILLLFCVRKHEVVHIQLQITHTSFQQCIINGFVTQ